MKKPTVLMILDGYGINDKEHGNAVKLSNTPVLDGLFNSQPNAILEASGLQVGLPEGQMGNSEVGHLNIGAGRVVYQDFTRITKSISDGDFFDNKNILKAIENVKENKGKLHLWGLLSDGGVHSHITHLYALLELAKQNGLDDVYVHCYLDGRDVPPSSAKEYITALENKMKELEIGKIATVSGRYYAMDRDKRWDRVKLAYDALTLGEGEKAESALEAIDNSYGRDELDEFVKPTVILEGKTPVALVEENDSVIMFNFRPDRAREITRAFVDREFDGFERRNGYFKTSYVCMTQYDESMPNVMIGYPPQTHKNTLGEYLSNLGKKQLRIAETEKYAHVTFFFNGGVEEANPGEDRVLIASPSVATYDMQPEMSIGEVTDKLLGEIDKDIYDLIVLNYANPDMVGHTGNLEAAIKAVEAVDNAVGIVVEKILSKNGQMLITADHGNSDEMIDDSGNPITKHSTNPVPLILVSQEESFDLSDGKLADIAPTLLTLMSIDVPKEMEGESLLVEKAPALA